MKNNSPVLIFTGGHHSSAMPVLRRLQEDGWKIVWIGHKYSMWADKSVSAEYREITQLGIRFYDLKAGKFYRNFHPLKLSRLPWGFLQAAGILASLKREYGSEVKGIVSFGGYLAVPVVICGWGLGIPSITHEQTVVSGWANRLVSRFVKKVAVSWPTSMTAFPSHKVVLTGIPLRSEIAQARETRNRSAAAKRPVLYITGGKQGSHILNTTIFLDLNRLLDRYEIHHQTGASTVYNDYQTAQDLKQQLPDRLSPNYHVYDYLSSDQVAHMLSKASLVISRAGAHIISELAYVGVPSVLIPLPNVSHDEQNQNAQYLSENGLAVILPQSTLNSESLVQAIDAGLKLKPQPLPIPSDGDKQLVKLITATFV